jgi:hypothetical protein
MHRAWLVTELRHAIIAEAAGRGGLEAPPRPTLAALARTCRLLSDVALDLLWRHLPDLYILARCLPESLWYIEERAFPLFPEKKYMFLVRTHVNAEG